jgi:tRNA pseudouridine55 synthase
MTSTHAVAVVKRALNAKKAGHAGTLDPLASGILPIALGEATKTVPFVMDGRKSYVFTVAWGVETDTDDAEGRPVQASNTYPSREAVEGVLPTFTGTIEQVPPRFSAIKIQGERAYDLARDGETVELQPRTVEIARLALRAHEGDRSVLEADCGKGTYVRAIARDLGRALGCLGHVAALRRTRVGPFSEENAATVAELQAAAEIPEEPTALRPVESALSDLPSVPVSRDMAVRLMRGQSILLRGRDAPTAGKAYATCGGILVAVGDVERGELVPHRVFHLGTWPA